MQYTTRWKRGAKKLKTIRDSSHLSLPVWMDITESRRQARGNEYLANNELAQVAAAGVELGHDAQDQIQQRVAAEAKAAQARAQHDAEVKAAAEKARHEAQTRKPVVEAWTVHQVPPRKFVAPATAAHPIPDLKVTIADAPALSPDVLNITPLDLSKTAHQFTFSPPLPAEAPKVDKKLQTALGNLSTYDADQMHGLLNNKLHAIGVNVSDTLGVAHQYDSKMLKTDGASGIVATIDIQDGGKKYTVTANDGRDITESMKIDLKAIERAAREHASKIQVFEVDSRDMQTSTFILQPLNTPAGIVEHTAKLELAKR